MALRYKIVGGGTEMRKVYTSPYYKSIFRIVWLIAWWFSMVGGVGFGLYQFYIQWNDLDWNPILIMGFVGVIGFVYVLIQFAVRMFIVSEQVILEEDTIIAHGWLQKEKQFMINEIVEIRKTHAGDNVFRYMDVEGKILMRAGASIKKFGEFMEYVLENAPNLVYFEFGKYTLLKKNWEKDPDMELINRARMRAEENRKKKVE